MKIQKLFLSVLSVFVLASQVFGQSSFRIADDSSSGTYKNMLAEIVGVCPNENLNIVEAQGVTGGAIGNLQALAANKTDAAFMHSDVFKYNYDNDPVKYQKFKTLLSLFLEPIHVVALKQSKTTVTEGRVFKTVTTINFNSLADTKGYNVGAAGGGVLTASFLEGQGKAGFYTVDLVKGDALIPALDRGEIVAAIFVGAEPLPNIEKLDKSKYKLIPIDESIANAMGGSYRPTKISYPGLTTGAIKTIAPIATIVTKVMNTPEKTAMQRKFRECFNKHLPELQDNGAPAWGSVVPNDEGFLQNYLKFEGATAAPKK